MSYKAFISYSHAADGKLAPALQRAIGRFGRAWYQRAAIHVFRDETNLSLSPGLWTSIEKALAKSEYFVILCSPEAAQSKWVRREVDYWLAHSSPEKLLIVLTNGEVVWNADAGDFDWTLTTLPENLSKVYSEEPLYMDLRWAGTADAVSLRNPRFREQVAEIVATLTRRSKHEVIGDDVRVQRKARRMAWAAATILLVLLAFAAVAGVSALRERNTARSRAIASHAIANVERAPDLALALSIEANKIATTREARDALGQALSLSRLVAILGHEGPVNTAVFSPDGRRVVTASDDARACVWNAATGRRVVDLLGHSAPVNSASFDPAGRLVVTASTDKTLRIWDAARGEQLLILKGHERAVNWAEFRKDGRRIVSASKDGSVRVWDVDSGRQIAVMSAGGEVFRASYDSSGSRIVTAGSEGAMLMDGQLRGWRPLVNRLVFATALSSQGLVATTVEAGLGSEGIVQIRSMDVLDRGESISIRLPGHGDIISDLEFSPDGSLLAVAGRPQSVRVWDLVEQRRFTPLAGHKFDVKSLRFNRDGTLIVTASQDGTARVWRPTSGTQVAALWGHEAEVNTAEFSLVGDKIVTASEDGTARVWRVDLVASPTLKDERAASITLSSEDDQEVLVGYYHKGAVDSWSPRKAAPPRTFDACTPLSSEGRAALERQLEKWREKFVAEATGIDPTMERAFFPKPSVLLDVSDRHLWTTCRDNIRKWDRADGHMLAGWVIPGGPYILASAMVNHRILILAAPDEAAPRLMELGVRLEQKAILSGQSLAMVADISMDGATVATASTDGRVALWNAASGRLIGVLTGHSARIRVVEFSADAAHIVTGSDDGTAIVWNVASRNAVTVLRPHSSFVFSAKFSSNGQFVATGEQNGTVRVWELPAGRLVMAVKPHDNPVSDLVFTKDGAQLAIASYDGAATLLPCHACGSLPDLLEKARQHLPAGFDHTRLEGYSR